MCIDVSASVPVCVCLRLRVKLYSTNLSSRWHHIFEMHAKNYVNHERTQKLKVLNPNKEGLEAVREAGREGVMVEGRDDRE